MPRSGRSPPAKNSSSSAASAKTASKKKKSAILRQFWRILCYLSFSHSFSSTSQHDFVCNPNISPDAMQLTLTVMIMHPIFPPFSRRTFQKAPTSAIVETTRGKAMPTVVQDFLQVTTFYFLSDINNMLLKPFM